jgi:hypothetical protein
MRGCLSYRRRGISKRDISKRDISKRDISKRDISKGAEGMLWVLETVCKLR